MDSSFLAASVFVVTDSRIGSSDNICPVCSQWATFMGLYVAIDIVERSTVLTSGLMKRHIKC